MGMQGIFGEAVDRIGGQPIPARMARRAPIRHIDPTLILATAMLAAYGAVMIYSATASKQEDAGLDPALFLKRQLLFIGIGLALLIGASLFDYRHLSTFSPIIYGLALVGLVVVLTPLGEVVQGARRWISLGPFQIQPSELAKLAVIMALGAFLAIRKGEMNMLSVAAACAIVAVPVALIFLEPDLGTASVFLFVLMAMLLIGGAKLRHFGVLFVVGVVAIAAVLQFGLLEDYQIDRITAFLDENPDVQSEGFQLTQSKIAIGSGGLEGKGFQTERTQTALDFIPEQHTDFIFTAVGEQLGFIGSATLLALFAFLIWRALRIAAIARDLFGTLLAGGIAAMWTFQLFVNVGMTMGIMPLTGITLPFISYGGSSLLINFIAAGLLLNVHMRRYL
jgi:rod shape determining protein RodA